MVDSVPERFCNKVNFEKLSKKQKHEKLPSLQRVDTVNNLLNSLPPWVIFHAFFVVC